MMEETQFTLDVWQGLPERLRSVALPMSGREVAWERDDALEVIQSFKDDQIAVEGIEFFFFQGTNEPLQATSDIFSAHKLEGESWEGFVTRSCSKADVFIREVYESESGRYPGRPVFNIWAVAENEETEDT